MYEETILNALKQYDIYIELINRTNNNGYINRIKECEKYIKQGNEVTADWLRENHTVLSKAVTYAHNLIHTNYIKSDVEYSSKEHKELNICRSFFNAYYDEMGIDSDYMNINF